MATLPKTIQAYLEDAGVSATEIHILKHLLTGEESTLRELALNLKKSTGIISSSCEKLLDRGLIEWNRVNQTSKISLTSVEVIQQWMKGDMEKKREALLRREKDFDAYIQSIQIEQARPDMHHYEGVEGFEQAYTKLLECQDTEILHYMPAVAKEEDDPLHNFRKTLIAEREKRGKECRVISHDTPLGRRYKERDHFEKRVTRLVPESEWPIEFEKVISGNLIAFLNHKDMNGFVIKSSELAEAERQGFKALWRIAGVLSGGTREMEVEEPFVVRLRSAMCEFFCEKKSVVIPMFVAVVGAIFAIDQFVLRPGELSIWRSLFASFLLVVGVFGGFFFREKKGYKKEALERLLTVRSLVLLVCSLIISSVVTYGMYGYTKDSIRKEIGAHLVAIATSAASEIAAEDINSLQTEEDWKNPEWRSVVRTLKSTKDEYPGIVYVYIYRKSFDNPQELEFVADAESINPYVNTDANPNNDIDANGDGLIEPDGPDLLQWPGQEYPDPPQTAFDAYQRSLVSSDIYEDAWGMVFTGYSPIRDSKGDTVGVIGVDMNVTDFNQELWKRFNPIIWMSQFLIGLLFFSGIVIFCIPSSIRSHG